jgi:WhiB family redox-sensing transcriptional regulator
MGHHKETFVLPFTGSTDWMGRAACADMDTEMFFCDPQSERETLDAALKVCYRCPVVNDCLNYALKNGLEGVWGGTREGERKLMMSKRRRA